MEKIRSLFEIVLWDSRLVVLFAVMASLLSGFAMFYIATVDAFYMISHLGHYASPEMDASARYALRGETVKHVVEIVDGYLLATFLLIFALGLYELFVSNIERAENSKSASSVLVIHSLDDLKIRLAKVVLMILIVKFFEYAIELKYQTPLDLVYLSAGIALVGLALFLGHASEKKS